MKSIDISHITNNERLRPLYNEVVNMHDQLQRLIEIWMSPESQEPGKILATSIVNSIPTFSTLSLENLPLDRAANEQINKLFEFARDLREELIQSLEKIQTSEEVDSKVKAVFKNVIFKKPEYLSSKSSFDKINIERLNDVEEIISIIGTAFAKVVDNSLEQENKEVTNYLVNVLQFRLFPPVLKTLKQKYMLSLLSPIYNMNPDFLLDFLLDLGVNLNSFVISGEPLWKVILKNKPSHLPKAIESGLDIKNAKHDKEGYLPLHFAALQKDSANVELLLSQGVKLNTITTKSLKPAATPKILTPLLWSLDFYYLPTGDTALLIAARNGYTDVAAAIAAKPGVNLQIMDNLGKKASDYMIELDSKANHEQPNSIPNPSADGGNLVHNIADYTHQIVTSWPIIQYIWNQMILPVMPKSYHNYTLPVLPDYVKYPTHLLSGLIASGCKFTPFLATTSLFARDETYSMINEELDIFSSKTQFYAGHITLSVVTSLPYCVTLNKHEEIEFSKGQITLAALTGAAGAYNFLHQHKDDYFNIFQESICYTADIAVGLYLLKAAPSLSALSFFKAASGIAMTDMISHSIIDYTFETLYANRCAIHYYFEHLIIGNHNNPLHDC